jgi:tight adherence protein B
MTAAWVAAAAIVLVQLVGSASPLVRLRAAGVVTAPPRRLDVRRLLLSRPRWWRRADRDRVDAHVVELLDAFAARLATGAAPAAAFAACLDDVGPGPVSGEWACAAQMMRWGSPAWSALRAAGPGSSSTPVLRWLATGWTLTETTGAPLGPIVHQLAGTVRADRQHRRAVDGELAGVRASARVLGALPLVGLLMGTALGAQPVAFLVGSNAGWCCLVLGVLLELAGLRWCRAIADSARAAQRKRSGG